MVRRLVVDRCYDWRISYQPFRSLPRDATLLHLRLFLHGMIFINLWISSVHLAATFDPDPKRRLTLRSGMSEGARNRNGLESGERAAFKPWNKVTDVGVLKWFENGLIHARGRRLAL